MPLRVSEPSSLPFQLNWWKRLGKIRWAHKYIRVFLVASTFCRHFRFASSRSFFLCRFFRAQKSGVKLSRLNIAAAASARRSLNLFRQSSQKLSSSCFPSAKLPCRSAGCLFGGFARRIKAVEPPKSFVLMVFGCLPWGCGGII